MLSDERKWEKFQKVVLCSLFACILGFLAAVSGLYISPEDSIFESLFLIFGFLIFGLTVLILLMIMIVLVILDIRELGAKQAVVSFVKSFFIYLGAAVLLVIMLGLLQNTLFQKGTIRDIWIFAISLDVGSYIGKFSKRRLPG